MGAFFIFKKYSKSVDFNEIMIYNIDKQRANPYRRKEKMKMNVTITRSVKPLKEPILLKTRLTDFMMWSEKTGQVECFVISYKQYTLYMVSHTKEYKTYTNYFETFDGMGSLFKALTRA